jgi:replicative DNA helicase
MKNEDLVDIRAYCAVFGSLLQDPTLLDDIDRPLDRTDFNTEKFYELLYVAIYNLHTQGCQVIDEFSIDSYLSNYKDQYSIFQNNRGLDYLVNARNFAMTENYDYNYHRVRKYSLLRYFEEKGLDTKFIYDCNIVDSKKSEIEQIKFDNYTEKQIVDMVESTFVIEPDMKYCTNTLSTNVQAADGMLDLVHELMEIPDVGLPLNNTALNTIARGLRLGCVYMRSAPQGGGKSRMLAGDACKIAVPYVWDTYENKWLYTGISEPAVYFTTEMQVDEIQTLFIAAVSKVNEDHILYGDYEKGELERVEKAIEYIESSPIYIVHIPDFSIADIVNLIKKYNREFAVRYFFFDYIHTSLRLMSEINNKSGMGLKEHQLLLVFITELKTVAQQLDVCIFTASQLNGEAQNATYKDQNLLAGSKALSNKLDVGIISMPPTKSELKRIEPVLHKMIGIPVPNMCHWIYKVRRGKLTRIIVWTDVDLGTMTENPLFVTDYDFSLIDIDFTQVEMVEEKIKEHSILISKIPDTEFPEEEESDDDDESEDDETVKTKFNW